MTDYDRTTVRTEEQTDGPVAPAPVTARPYGLTRRTIVEETARPTPALVLQRIVALLFGILQVLLILRILLLLLGANHANAIVDAIIQVTNPFVEPFRGMFRFDTIDTARGSVFDMAALVALVGWSLIESLIIAVLRLGGRDRATA
jgi:hypothetical protein